MTCTPKISTHDKGEVMTPFSGTLSRYPQKRCRVEYGMRFKQAVQNVACEALGIFFIVLSTYVVFVCYFERRGDIAMGHYFP